MHDEANRVCVAVLATVFSLPLASVAGAQVTSATLLGAVTDSSGAALPGVAVTARNFFVEVKLEDRTRIPPYRDRLGAR